MFLVLELFLNVFLKDLWKFEKQKTKQKISKCNAFEIRFCFCPKTGCTEIDALYQTMQLIKSNGYNNDKCWSMQDIFPFIYFNNKLIQLVNLNRTKYSTLQGCEIQ